MKTFKEFIKSENFTLDKEKSSNGFATYLNKLNLKDRVSFLDIQKNVQKEVVSDNLEVLPSGDVIKTEDLK